MCVSSRSKVQKSSFSSKYAKVSDAGREARTDFQVVEVYEDNKPGLSGVMEPIEGHLVDNLYHLDTSTRNRWNTVMYNQRIIWWYSTRGWPERPWFWSFWIVGLLREVRGSASLISRALSATDGHLRCNKTQTSAKQWQPRASPRCFPLSFMRVKPLTGRTHQSLIRIWIVCGHLWVCRFQSLPAVCTMTLDHLSACWKSVYSICGGVGQGLV